MKITQGEERKPRGEGPNKHCSGDAPGRKMETIIVTIISNWLYISQKLKEPKGDAEVPRD